MKKERFNHNYSHLRQPIFLVIICLLTRGSIFAQNFIVSFPIGSTVYQESEIPLTVAISGVKCNNTVIKCHKGLVSMVGKCKYIYRCKTVGIDTVEVFIRRGDKTHRIGQQVFEVKQRPLPQASIAGLKGGIIAKGALKAQQGVGAEFYIAGNHWENCTVEGFSFILLRNEQMLFFIRNEGNHFTEETRAALQQIQSGDKVLVTNIKGCLQQGGGNLKTLEFTIE